MKRGGPTPGRQLLGEMIDRSHCATSRALYFRMALWLSKARNPTAQMVMDRFDVGRATAYRVIEDWRDAQGLISK
jgi:hypothetical protein